MINSSFISWTFKLLTQLFLVCNIYLFMVYWTTSIFSHCPFVQMKKYSTPTLQFFMKFNMHYVFHTLLKNKVFNSDCTVWLLHISNNITDIQVLHLLIPKSANIHEFKPTPTPFTCHPHYPLPKIHSNITLP
jgi:hypothetical protein